MSRDDKILKNVQSDEVYQEISYTLFNMGIRGCQ